METKTCLQCNNKLQGRTDKKFCDDQCRTAFHNCRKASNTILRQINNTLRKNRSIMERMFSNETEKLQIPIRKLIQSGFDFGFYTHSMTNNNGSRFYFCYEFGYRKSDDKTMVLMKRTQKEMG